MPEEVRDNLFLLPGSPVIEDIDRRMTISEGQLQDAGQRNWQGAPLHVSGVVVHSSMVLRYVLGRNQRRQLFLSINYILLPCLGHER